MWIACINNQNSIQIFIYAFKYILLQCQKFYNNGDWLEALIKGQWSEERKADDGLQKLDSWVDVGMKIFESAEISWLIPVTGCHSTLTDFHPGMREKEVLIEIQSTESSPASSSHCNLTWQYQISSLLEHVHLSICLGLQLQKEHYLLWKLQIKICNITLKARLKIESRSQLRERIVVDILSLSAIIPWSDHLGPPSLSWDTDHASLCDCSLRQQHSFQHFQPNKRSDKLSVPQSLIIRISYPSFEHLYRLQLSYFPNSSLLLCSADKVDW